MYNYLFRKYRIISVMFWAFPYLFWQAFGHWSGFVVGVIVAVILTMMLNDLFYVGCSHPLSSARQQSFQRSKPQPRDENVEQYCAGTHLYYMGEDQPQHAQLQVLYQQEEMRPKEAT